MQELVQSSLPWLPVSLGFVLLLLLGAIGGRCRPLAAVILLLAAGGFGVVAYLDQDQMRHLNVVNPFRLPGQSEPQPVVMEQVDAAGWQWPLVLLFACLLPALLFLLGRSAPLRAPRPGLTAAMIGVAVLAVRLALEKTAAPPGLVWACGLNYALPLLLLFAGGAAARAGMSFLECLGSVLGMALLQRGALSLWSFFATTQGLGTYLDVRALQHISPPVLGDLDLTGDPFRQWLWGVAVLQLTLWVALTMVAGIVLGGVGFALLRKRP